MRHEWVEGWAVLPGDPHRHLHVEFGIECGPLACQPALQDWPEVALLFGAGGRAGFALLRVWVADEERALTELLQVCVKPETEL